MFNKSFKLIACLGCSILGVSSVAASTAPAMTTMAVPVSQPAAPAMTTMAVPISQPAAPVMTTMAVVPISQSVSPTQATLAETKPMPSVATIATAPLPVAQVDASMPAKTVQPAPAQGSPAPAVNYTIVNCSAENGKLGDANPSLRDYCLTQQSNDIIVGQMHKALPFAMEYYNAMQCGAAIVSTNINCQNAANTIANGLVLAFHLNMSTLSKIRNALAPGAAQSCPCQNLPQ